MKFRKLQHVISFTAFLFLQACDPASIDPDTLGSAANESGNDSSLGLFQLISDDFDGGTLSDSDISVSYGSKSGTGTASSPLVFGLGNIYTFTWETSISEDATLEFSIYSPDNPDVETNIAKIECESSNSTECGSEQEMECWFTGYEDSVYDYSTQFNCTVGDDSAESIDTLEGMALAIQPEWSGYWSELDLTVGLKARLCRKDSDSSCDVATLGHLKLEEYIE